MKQDFIIGTLETRILGALQRDASISMADLAQEARSSTATCWRRIRDMEEAGVIGAPVRIVDPARVGRGMDAFCQVRMKAQNAGARAAFQKAMEAEPSIVEVYSISGDWDYLLHLVVRDIADLESILMNRVHELDCVASASTLFVLRRVKHTTAIPV
ncbi:Lrp/AsnC ligand binding domain-containing protein [Pseudooceanicola sp. CBS1P-1]|uniref:Winged helix-turn-helix transcriptional regulator n=1 Tax=Pseudooceanicola albus TaxID=2692189 RepID=A0A6L7G5I5_9RHOB|nr:Lrp/AsnC ligand binding domain-containing protein [Pseudooceanicola endophyticus]MXN18748.1 winged helix-turn-helix transcriptional regulator [Pseudooceanicola albus]